MKTDAPTTNEELVPDYLSLYAKGRRTFSLLFSRWMDTNEWSHACMGGVRWLHSSQISGLRHNGLENPGPRTFIALERLNPSAVEPPLIPLHRERSGQASFSLRGAIYDYPELYEAVVPGPRSASHPLSHRTHQLVHVLVDAGWRPL